MANRTVNPVQMVLYIKRNPKLTLPQFYDYWENVHAPKVVPWAEKHGFIRYQQVHTSGTIVPPGSTNGTPISYDGIALFTVSSLESHSESLKDRYYVDVVEPDEHELIDKNGYGQGVLATYRGKLFDMIDGGKGRIGEKGEESRRVWEEFERKRAKL